MACDFYTIFFLDHSISLLPSKHGVTVNAVFLLLFCSFSSLYPHTSILVQRMTKWIIKKWQSKNWRAHFNQPYTRNERIVNCVYWSTWITRMLLVYWTYFIQEAIHSNHFSRSTCAPIWWVPIWITLFEPSDYRTITYNFWCIKFCGAWSTFTVPESYTG